MTNLEFITCDKTEVPLELREELIKTLMENNAERYNLPPANKEYYNIWFDVENIDYQKNLQILVILDGEIIGSGGVSWKTKFDNTDKGFVGIYIRKDFRRRGFGTLSIKKLLSLLPDFVKIVFASALHDSPGYQFLKKLGGKEAISGVLNVSLIREFDFKEVRQEIEPFSRNMTSKGYEIVCIENFDIESYFDREDFTRMYERVAYDAPLENLSWDRKKITWEELKNSFTQTMKYGSRPIFFVVKDTKTEQPIGFTNAGYDQNHPDVCYQSLTGVVQEHRGNRLGLILKLKLLDKILKETKTTHWITGNAGSNDHMININRKLGHIEWARTTRFEYKVEDLREQLNI